MGKRRLLRVSHCTEVDDIFETEEGMHAVERVTKSFFRSSNNDRKESGEGIKNKKCQYITGSIMQAAYLRDMDTLWKWEDDPVGRQNLRELLDKLPELKQYVLDASRFSRSHSHQESMDFIKLLDKASNKIKKAIVAVLCS